MDSSDHLEQLKSALKIVSALGDGAFGVPVLHAVAGSAIEIIDIAQALLKNQKDARELAKSAAERISSLLDAFIGKSKADIPPDVQQDIERYAQKLEHVQKILGGLVKKKHWRRLLARVSDRDRINHCKDDLNESFQVLAAPIFFSSFILAS
ncbi:hypothetical protein B0H15DRAFT_653472 [Mycena belliarum]|uniref:Uncharacterized protein n=1 Tax=Mycena belliarum TaxID=1033014 RepID=A0AAD6TQQ3_9AGAR|nr:hypothetical protein B0H15DRAFT_653472 [Mycena belliae]